MHQHHNNKNGAAATPKPSPDTAANEEKAMNGDSGSANQASPAPKEQTSTEKV